MAAKPATPERPVAVYRLYDHAGTLLYIGASVNPHERMKAHRSGSKFRAQIDPARIVVEWHDTRADACAAEASAIETERPLHNAQGAHLPYVPYARPVGHADLSTPEVARVLGVTGAVVRRLMQQQELAGAYYDNDGGYRVPSAGLIAYIVANYGADGAA